MPAVTSTPSTPTSPASAQKKFNTVTAFTSRGSQSPHNNGQKSPDARTSVKGFFDVNRNEEGGNQPQAQTSPVRANHTSPSRSKGTLGREDGPWSVSVAEMTSTPSEKRESRKKTKGGLHMYTLYITTPTHNITLLRSNVELIELDTKIREGQSTSSTLPTLPILPQSTQQTSRKFFQTISRTLSPGVSRNRSGFNVLTASGLGLQEPPSPSTPSPQTSTPDEAKAQSASHATTTHLATYLTTLSNLAMIKKHKAWRRFTRVGSDDLESVRVERRVRKVRSDLAQHVKSSVAPTNVNVGATPSQSDIGEEGTRTDDDRSISGRSTSHSYRRTDKPEVPARSASAEQREEQAKKLGNFAGIPEELEREKMAADQDTSLDNGDEANTSTFVKREKRHRRHTQREAEKVTVDDFDMIRVLGKGCAGKVLLVRHLPTKGLFAMKSIHKRHVLAHQELQHTLTEQAVLKRMAKEVMDPFVVKLWWSFHDKNNLYLIMDFHPGGDLATQLSRWGRLGRDRARFYAAEIVEGVEGLHRAGVIYRDLKPENVLIGSDGHIVLSDFGLSKEFPVRDGTEVGGTSTPPPGSPTRSHSSKDLKNGSPHWMSASASEDNRSSVGAESSTSNSAGFDAFSAKGSRTRWMDERDVTTTFCGTAEYLAPEVIQGAAYSYEVDWWSFGTMLYEMLTGITPFWADTHADMYVRVLHDELIFPDDRVLDQDTKSILRGLLQRNPMLRMKEPRIKRHPYFSMIEWAHVFHKRYIPPYIPPINPLDETDTQNFDEAFLDMQPVVNGAEDGLPEETAADADVTAVSDNNADLKTAKVLDGNKLTSKDTNDIKSLFDGYSFRGRKDSGSIKSSVLSLKAPSDKVSVEAASVVQESPIVPQSPPSRAAPSAITARSASIESEDDITAARAAVLALDQLEREAADAEASLINPPPPIPSPQQASMTPPAPIAATPNGKDALNIKKFAGSSTATKVRLAPKPAVVTDDEGDDDWDMIDAPVAGEGVTASELNGGKGQNLFARGVVDTYRLLRRQDTSRLPSTPSYGSMNRPFNRLRKSRSTMRNLRPRTSDQNGNGSAISLGKSSANEGAMTEEENQDMVESRIGGPSPLPSSSTHINSPSEEASRQGKAGSPSLASSEDIASQEKNRQRIKKIKRFTSLVYQKIVISMSSDLSPHAASSSQADDIVPRLLFHHRDQSLPSSSNRLSSAVESAA
jgi:serum/glucocorticoid-regulated kinase 2